MRDAAFQFALTLDYDARTYEFVRLDVFTRTPVIGNPLAVFTDARSLADKEMQALARDDVVADAGGVG